MRPLSLSTYAQDTVPVARTIKRRWSDSGVTLSHNLFLIVYPVPQPPIPQQSEENESTTDSRSRVNETSTDPDFIPSVSSELVFLAREMKILQ